MKRILIISTLLISSILSNDVLDKEEMKLWDEHKKWNEKWSVAVIDRNKELTKKYGKNWYEYKICVTIPKEELMTKEMKKLTK